MVWKYIKNGGSLALDADKCTGCGACMDVCPHNVFMMTDNKAFINLREACMECGACKLNCPAGAIGVNSGVGCAAAVIGGMLGNKSPSCGCGEEKTGSCC
jgi:NAD-dependent dihydropyrimidine dehydrogenase PreA subunit